ncbi:beta-galactoside-binding lectin-like [Parambassis ranga]|uniref:Galectin n=1 Tax=Parambassis ranga TaxID=210632 RepID=A0A6P7JUV4_9TELE|nr:beta-galactoside-binding lectin-like [Parambassis ranga]
MVGVNPITVGQTLTIVGVPNSSAKQFAVNICPNDKDVTLQINPRFRVHEDIETVVYNSCKGGSWGKEMRDTAFPFVQEQEFKMVIKFNSEEFVVRLSDGLSFPFKIPPDVKDWPIIIFNGDVRIKSIKIN